jgi:hypothetical protein
VVVEFVDGTRQEAVIYEVADVAEVPDQPDGVATVAVVIAPTGAVDVPDGSPVDVELVEDLAEGVLAVPVSAIAAYPDGTFAVERLRGDGTTETVAVELGRFADGWVAVTGSVAEGDEVVAG